MVSPTFYRTSQDGWRYHWQHGEIEKGSARYSCTYVSTQQIMHCNLNFLCISMNSSLDSMYYVGFHVWRQCWFRGSSKGIPFSISLGALMVSRRPCVGNRVMEFSVTRIMAPTSLPMAAHRWVLPARANASTKNLTDTLNKIFSLILRTTRRPMRMQYSNFSRFASSRVTSA